MRMWSEISQMRERALEDQEADRGCAFVIDSADPISGRVNFCNAPRDPGSAYCRRHRDLCHLVRQSPAERRALCEIEALATAVGGRQGRAARSPSPVLLRRLDRIAKAFSRSNRS
jgi:hypothetical protein